MSIEEQLCHDDGEGRVDDEVVRRDYMTTSRTMTAISSMTTKSTQTIDTSLRPKQTKGLGAVFTACGVLAGAVYVVVIKSFIDIIQQDPSNTTFTGYSEPALLAILIIFGRTLSVPVYCFQRILHDCKRAEDTFESNNKAPESQPSTLPDASRTDHRSSHLEVSSGSASVRMTSTTTRSGDSFIDQTSKTNSTGIRSEAITGSTTGLSIESHQSAAANWTRQLPWWLRPLLPGIVTMISVFTLAFSVLYLEAGLLDMLLNAVQLIGSVFTAKFIRKRAVSLHRWIAVGIVTFGVLILWILPTYVFQSYTSTTSSVQQHTIGIFLIILTALLLVVKSIFDELVLQETVFPPILYLGVRSVYAFIMAIPVYFIIAIIGQPAGSSGYKEDFAWMGASKTNVVITVLVILSSFLYDVCNLLSTAYTSSLTANLWKQLRGLTTFVIAITLYYVAQAIGTYNLGSAWAGWGSVFVLVGYAVISIGVYVYYCGLPGWLKIYIAKEDDAESDETNKNEAATDSGASPV